MTRLYLLDTNTVIYILKGKSPAARERLASLAMDEVACLSVISEAELRYGLAKADAVNEKRSQALEWFLGRLQVLVWGRNEAACYATLWAKQERMGKTLGPLDLQIAAHAVATQAILVTSDKAFRQVPDLRGVEDWAADL